MAKPKVSVIIPVYNRATQVIRCIESVILQSYKDVEIIVVDDGSSDNTWDALKKISGIITIKHKKSLGPGASRNTGVKASKGKLLVFLDSDCWPTNFNWLKNHVLAHELSDDELVSGIVKGLHHTYGGSVFSYVNWFMFMGKKGVISAPYVPMANLSVSKNLFDRIGPFDTTKPVYEDVDWSYRAKAIGINFNLINNATVYHEDREGLKNVFKHQKQFGMWTIHLRQRYPNSIYCSIFPKTLISSIIMCVPLSILMTLYITITVIRNHPKVIWYTSGILFTQLGYSLGVIQFFHSERKLNINLKKLRQNDTT